MSFLGRVTKCSICRKKWMHMRKRLKVLTYRLRVGKDENHIQAVKKKKMKAKGRRRQKSDLKHISRIT